MPSQWVRSGSSRVTSNWPYRAPKFTTVWDNRREFWHIWKVIPRESHGNGNPILMHIYTVQLRSLRTQHRRLLLFYEFHDLPGLLSFILLFNMAWCSPFGWLFTASWSGSLLFHDCCGRHRIQPVDSIVLQLRTESSDRLRTWADGLAGFHNVVHINA